MFWDVFFESVKTAYNRAFKKPFDAEEQDVQKAEQPTFEVVDETYLMTSTRVYGDDIDLEGKEVVVVGKGKLVGRPIIYQLLNAGATVTVCHSKTEDLKKHTLSADIIISAAGVKGLITEDMVKDDVIVIDVGCSIENGKVYGDVDSKIEKKASMITSKTGCIGPLSIAMFLKNVMTSYNNKK